MCHRRVNVIAVVLKDEEVVEIVVITMVYKRKRFAVLVVLQTETQFHLRRSSFSINP